MKDIITSIESLRDMRHLSPASCEDIQQAQQALNLVFAEEYRTYVKKYGVVSADGIELTGVTSVKRLSVVDTTRQERELSGIPDHMYVVQNLGIDGIMILQDEQGFIYQVSPHRAPERIAGSLAEYIQKNNLSSDGSDASI